MIGWIQHLYVENKALAAVSQNGTSLRHCAEPLRDDQAGAEW